MAVFEYKALEESGKQVKGVIDADSPVAARRKLREQQLFPTKIKQNSGSTGTQADSSGLGLGGVSTRDLSLMTRQLAVLLNAGMPLSDALNAMLQHQSNWRSTPPT